MHEEQLILGIGEGILTHEALECTFSELIASGGMSYSKLFDFSGAVFAVSTSEVRAMGKRVADYAKAMKLGPVAVVVDSDAALAVAELFQTYAPVDRPFRIFHDFAKAQEWLRHAAET